MVVGAEKTLMRKKCAAIALSVLLVIFGALAAYAECSQVATHHDSGTEHDPSAIHCPDAVLLSNIQAVSTIQSHSRILSNVPPSIDQKLDRVVLPALVKDHPFWEPVSQQDLFRFEEVYRL